MSNAFCSVQISLKGSTVAIQYKVDPNFNGKAPYKFKVLAYEDNTFTEPLYSIDSDTFFAIDDHNIRQNVRPSFLYRVQLTTADNKKFISNFVGWSPGNDVDRHKYLIASEVTRREHVRFNYAGIYAYLLKRKSYSPAATNDVDPVTGEAVIDSSSSSYGVGVVGGYYTPILCRFSIESRQVNEDYDQQGKGVAHLEVVKIRSVGFPFIEQHDVFTTSDGKRYIVTDPGNKFFPGTTLILLQTSSLRLVPDTDTIYSIDVPKFPNA